MSDEHTVAIVSEHGALMRMADRIRKKFAAADLGYMSLEIKIKGKPDGKPTMSYEVSHEQYGAPVKGNDLDETVRECLRRQGWTEVNKPLEITFEPTGDNPTTDMRKEE